MQEAGSLKKYKIRSPAKINLFLHIIGKRPDGYHDIISLICGVGLYDTLLFTFNAKILSVSCAHPLVPEDETNLVFLAARLFLDKIDKNEPFEIVLNKQIPVGAGLGGGSSNAASVLLFLNKYYHYPFSIDELILMGASLGSDVPFFIFQKPAIVSGTGENLKSFDNLSQLFALIIYPGFSLSTSMVYKDFDLGLTNNKKKVIKSILSYNHLDLQFNAFNGLHNDLEDIVFSKYPEICKVKKVLLNNGAESALMTGSGSAVFGLFSDLEAAKKAKCSISRCGKWQIYLAELLV